MEEQYEVTVRDLSKTYVSNTPDGEFKPRIIRILAGLERIIEDWREALTAEIKS